MSAQALMSMVLFTRSRRSSVSGAPVTSTHYLVSLERCNTRSNLDFRPVPVFDICISV
jgi:hypothetical protein